MMFPSSTNTFKRKRRTQQGASAVEMAMVLPLLFLMVDGVMELGLILHNQSVLSSATSVAARAGIAQGGTKLNPVQIAALASNYCLDNLISPMPTSAAAIFVVQSPDSSYQTPLQVTAQYKFSGLLVGAVLGAFQANPVLSATTVMYNE